MTSTSRRLIAALLLASYGLVSACGAGLHALVDDSHVVGTGHSSDDDHSTPSSSSTDHSDCLICHVVGQGQILARPEPIPSGSTTVGQVIAAVPIALHTPDRLPSDPRAPPIALA
jgi:hypothetical protein